MLLIIDNYDSFTYNLVQYFQILGAEVEVTRNDDCTVADVIARRPSHIVISPGPGRPNQAGISLAVVRTCAPNIPILGVCLGHQCIGQVYGASIIRAPLILHGRTSLIRHSGQGVLAGLADGFEATRYHSLVIDPADLPDCLQVTAWTEHRDGRIESIMGVRHRHYPVEGVQFHPESILTQHGLALLRHFLTGR